MFEKRWKNYNTLQEGILDINEFGDVLQLLDSASSDIFIFFDIETTGFMADEFDQVLEIAAIAVDPQSWNSEPKVLKEFRVKASLNPYMQKVLNDKTSQEYQNWLEYQQKTTWKATDLSTILDKVQYYDKESQYIEEQQAIQRFLSFVEQYNSPLLIAHNAKFDLGFLTKRSEAELPDVRVLDTLVVARKFLIPIFQGLNKKDPEYSEYLLNSVTTGYTKKGARKTTFKQGILASMFKIDIEDWHSAIADVKMLMKLLQVILKIAKQADFV